MKQVTIYTLSHPVTNEVFYVGRTTMILKQRLCCHVTNRQQDFHLVGFIADIIKSTGKRPIIEGVDTCLYNVRRQTEEFWIQMFSSWGFPLRNVRHNKNKNFIPREEVITKYTKFSDADLELINLLHSHNDYGKLAKILRVNDETIRLVLYKKGAVKKVYYTVIMSYYKEKARAVAEWYNSKQIAA